MIWRRILIPETYYFWDLHVAIQDSMGWLDYHLHEFELKNPSPGEKECIGIPPIEPRVAGVSYSVCVGGESACPPEDSGGPRGYGKLLEIIMDPDHERYKEMTAWVGARFDPESFDPEKVRFDDPTKRLRRAME